MDDLDFLPATDEGESPSAARSRMELESREDLRAGIEAQLDGFEFAEDRRTFPEDDDNTVRGDLYRSALEVEENQHMLAMDAMHRARLQEIDEYSRRQYGQGAYETFSQLDAAHGLMLNNPREFAARVMPIINNPREYEKTFANARMEHALSVVSQFAEEKGIRAGSALEKHLSDVVGSAAFKRTGDMRKDLLAGYKEALRRANAAA